MSSPVIMTPEGGRATMEVRIDFKFTGESYTLPNGVYDIDHTIEMGDGTPTRNSTIAALSITGQGAGANEGELDNLAAGTLLRWRGKPGEPMIRVNGPIHSARIARMSLDCAGIASGVQLDHPVCGNFKELQIRNVGPNCFGLRIAGTAEPRSGLAVNAGGSKFRQVHVLPGPNAVGFQIGSDSGRVGASNLMFEQCGVLGGAIGWLLRMTDFDGFYMCSSYQSAIAIQVEPPLDNPIFPGAIYMHNFTTFNQDCVKVVGDWKAWPNVGIKFTDFHREYGGGDPTLDSSFGPIFPKIKGVSGTDNLGNVYPHIKTH